MAKENDRNDDTNKEKGKVTSKAEACDWMEHLRDDLTIRDVTMFGTHSSCDPGTQKETIFNQLRYGARFLDLHLAKYDGKVCVYHDNPATCIKLEEACDMIIKFIKGNEEEKVIVYLQNSNTENMKVEWTEIEALFPKNMKEKFISKSESEKKLKEMKGNIILIAPNALDIDANWGADFIKPYPAPKDTDSLVGLHAFLFETAVDELDEKKDKLIWVEARSRRKEDDKRIDDEITEVTDVFIKDTEFYNIVTFSLLDSGHFERLKSNGMFKFPSL